MALVMIVESDMALASALRMALAWNGYRVVEARNGAAAVGLLKSRDLPDLILTGLDIPFVSGRELLEICQRDPRLRHVPTVALVDADQARRQYPATATLAKPFGIEALLQLVQSTLAAATRAGEGNGS